MTILTILAIVGAGTIGGVFFAFSVFVMRALAQLPPAAGIEAMQRINVTVLHPLFLGTFLGTVPLLGAAAIAAYRHAAGDGIALLVAAFLVYLLGVVGVTVVFNVPRNNRLAALAPDSTGAREYWPVYLREWQGWNHLRCAASLLAAAIAALALA